ncbi:MAG: HNH endonuclease signature motif containing protein, partial [Myxococcota bacterium]
MTWRRGQKALLKRFSRLVRSSRVLEAELLEVLQRVEAERLHAVAGYGSLFAFCVEAHGMSESQAAKRIRAARLARRHPRVLGMLRTGELRLGGIHVLGKLLDGCRDPDAVLDRARGRTVRQLEALVAELRPRPDVASSVRKLPARRKAGGSRAPSASVPSDCVAGVGAGGPLQDAGARQVALGAKADEAPSGALPMQASAVPASSRGGSAPARRDPDPMPLRPGRYRVTVTLDEASVEALRELQDLCAHEQPDRDPGPLIAKAIRLALAEKRRAVRKERKRKPRERSAASTRRAAGKPSEASSSSTTASGRSSRRAPAAVVREVWARDGGRCTYVSPDGRRCGETACLELDHAVPWAKGGASTTANLRLRCRTHNQLAAEALFGRRFVEAKREGRCRESVVAYALGCVRAQCGT